MELKSLYTVKKIIETGSYLNASKALNYAQSTITSQIQQLEQELKFPLFERIGRRNYLTTGGQEFLPHAVQIVHTLQKSKLVGRDPREVEGTLRIGVMTDTHIGKTKESCARVKLAYQLFRKHFDTI